MGPEGNHGVTQGTLGHTRGGEAACREPTIPTHTCHWAWEFNTLAGHSLLEWAIVGRVQLSQRGRLCEKTQRGDRYWGTGSLDTSSPPTLYPYSFYMTPTQLQGEHPKPNSIRIPNLSHCDFILPCSIVLLFLYCSQGFFLGS